MQKIGHFLANINAFHNSQFVGREQVRPLLVRWEVRRGCRVSDFGNGVGDEVGEHQKPAIGQMPIDVREQSVLFIHVVSHFESDYQIVVSRKLIFRTIEVVDRNPILKTVRGDLAIGELCLLG